MSGGTWWDQAARYDAQWAPLGEHPADCRCGQCVADQADPEPIRGW